MARKATVDRDIALRMLRDGQSTNAVAEYFGVSRQAVDLHRKEFIQRGLLTERRAPRKATVLGETVENKEKGSPPVSLDRLVDLVIEAFNSLKRVPELERELERYKRDSQRASERIEQLEKEVSKRKEQESRWRLAMRQGESSPTSKDK